MRRATVLLLFICFIFSACGIALAGYSGDLQANTERGHIALVAHAGGAVEGFPDTNSLEALENAVKLGFRYIEVDMILSSDGEIVLKHSWEQAFNRIVDARNHPMSHQEFMESLLFNRFTTMDLPMLIDFLRENPGPRIVTDTKDTGYKALYVIARDFPQYISRFIPQVYAMEDVEEIRALGFDDIILTVYMMGRGNQNPAALQRFAMRQGLYAVTVPDEIVTPSFVRNINTETVRFMAHTINSAERAVELSEIGFYAIYTGFLAYGENPGEISLMDLPVNPLMARVSETLEGLTDSQRELLSLVRLYKSNSPVFINRGEAEPVWSWYFTAVPFINPANGLAYFVARHFTYEEGHTWNSADRSLEIVFDGVSTTVGGPGSADVLLHRDILYVSETVIENVFPCEVVTEDEFILVMPVNGSLDSDEIFRLAEVLFGSN